MNTRTQQAKNNCNGKFAARPHGRSTRLIGRIALGAAVTSFVAALLVFVPLASRATQLTFSNSPLFVTVPVPSNIFFLNDDSGSMDWAFATSESDGIMTLGTCSSTAYTYFYTHPNPGVSAGAYAPATNDYTYVIATEAGLSAAGVAAPYGGVWRARNKDYNKLYYNPDVQYKPWQGVDVNGATFNDASPTAAPYNPYRPSHGTLNLTGTISYTTDYCAPPSGPAISTVTDSNFYPAHYYVWTDTDSDGVVDAGDAHTLYEIRSSGCSTGATCPSSFTRTSARTDCTVSGSTATCTVAQELQNFTNWFSYHRKRDLTAKRATGSVIGQAQSESRMGLATINNNNSNGVNVQQMNADLDINPKKALLDALYNIKPAGGTPLRTKLDETGKLFECVSGNILGLSAGSTSCPIVSAASGGSCQQNFTVLMTDGYWNDSFSGLGNVDTDGNSPNAAGNTTFDGDAYADSYSNTLADIAMHYYERDLAAGLSNQVPVTAGIDNATHQHMVTYGVGFGVTGALSNNPPNTTDAFAWPAVAANASTTVDDLRHAAYNGRGQFLSASSPQDLITALQNTIGSIGDRTGSSAAVAVNSRNLTAGTRVYQVRFTSGEWSGDLRALAFNASVDVDTVVWSAKDQIKNQNWDTGRAILTRDSTAGVAFRWTAINASQQADLNDNPATTAVDNDSKGENRLKWLRGDNTNEGTGANFRVRVSNFKLGDIVGSAPTYVGAPPYLPNIESVTHSSFRTTYATRRAIVYAGANDGMLHGFDDATGQEKLAYVPSMVFSNLNKLTDRDYAHRHFVDGPPVSGDVYGTFTNVSGVCSTGCWRTVLTGGLGAGDKGIFALDITDPDGATISGLAFNEANAAKIALWEYTDASSGDMGYVFGQPNIVRVRNGTNTTAWAVVFGNGYNSTNENAALYVVNAVTGALIRKIVLNPLYTGWRDTANTNGNPPNSNGLSMPAMVDTNGDYIVDYAYAGDLRGNLWKVDLTSDSPSSWDSAYKSGSTAKPLFQTVDGTTATTVEQPITTRPEVGNHPDNLGGYMIYFGTGRYLASGDNTAATSPVHTFYGVWDKSYTGSGTPVVRADLLPQTISSATVGSRSVRGLTNTTMQWRTGASGTCQSDGTGNCLGCRVDLLTAQAGSLGEKQVTNSLLLSGTVPKVLFNTLIPETNACTAGGRGLKMVINPKNCGRPAEQVFDVDGDGEITSADMINGTTPVAGVDPGIGILSEPTVIRDSATGTDISIESGSSGDIGTERLGGGVKGGRQSWRQLR